MLAVAQLLFDEEDSDDDRLEELMLCRRRMQIRTRHDTNSHCLPHPSTSASVSLLRSMDDVAYISRLGLPAATFHKLLQQFHHFIPRHNPHGLGGRPPKLNPAQALALVLEFYASTCELKTLGALYGITPRQAGRWLQRGESALYKVLRNVPLARISWPSFDTQVTWGTHMQQFFPLVPNRFGYVDGKNLPVQEPSACSSQECCVSAVMGPLFGSSTMSWVVGTMGRLQVSYSPSFLIRHAHCPTSGWCRTPRSPLQKTCS